MRTKYHMLSSLVLFVIIFVCTFTVSKDSAIRQNSQLDISKLATRIALDLDMLPIADPLFNYSGNEQKVAQYIVSINQQLETNKSRVRLLKLTSSGNISQLHNSHHYTLNSAHRQVGFVYEVNTYLSWVSYILPVAVALMVWGAYLWAFIFSRREIKEMSFQESVVPNLVIDLNTKYVSLSTDQQVQIQLANKPLCFYIALVEYSVANPDVILNPNKDVPDELIAIANKYFERLTTLGHTVRKKPNFSNSLEKTLSEIRAALDEVFAELPELKTKYYPPKAYGEGSRSKLHSYSLVHIELEDIEVIGK
ncbi:MULTISPECIES: hypothetical protein [Pseudoalteromonas]|uniref:Uncharacterized protein n=1 Tax=Pseudoalteromonas amylolytica TaxID=1859457 RepID=A0A1S1MZ44_9GAMM|nr:MULTISPECIES: hypothetical protein [Pseudoalteromonas]OHU85355.1 hypothetical protein BFC16_18545 [Pseudoalteromonas sp. JW3]OHU93024.1 hypothetical protein BET10_03170 [Pseudoalteromonas amylolytica]